MTPDQQRMIDRAVGLYEDARLAGWPREEMEKLMAVTMAETTANLFPIGDEDRAGELTWDGRHWGVSYGPVHVRSIQEETGTGSARDIERLQRSNRDAYSAALEIFNESGWTPWSSAKSIKGAPPRYLEYKPYAAVVSDIVRRMESGIR